MVCGVGGMPDQQDDATLEHFVAAGAGVVQRVEGRAKVPAGEWAHIAAVQRGPSLRLYLNGRPDGELKLPAHMARPAR